MKNKSIIKNILLIFKGILVGFGAIMPGISGGTLCVSFGMYTPLINVMTHPIKALREDGVKLAMFVLGAGIGFVGLSGLAGWLMEVNSTIVILVFIGFIIGTMPDLWKTAGEKGRSKFSFLFALLGFSAMLAILIFLRNTVGVALEPSILSFFLCGILWALSFIVPGLSSSTLIMFFGLYQSMLEGISSFSIPVILPLGVGMVLCLILVSKAVGAMYEKWYSQISHIIIGVVGASMVMVIPFKSLMTAKDITVGVIAVVAGTVVSLMVGKLCDKLT